MAIKRMDRAAVAKAQAQAKVRAAKRKAAAKVEMAKKPVVTATGQRLSRADAARRSANHKVTGVRRAQGK